jgi:hypothetical protein
VDEGVVARLAIVKAVAEHMMAVNLNTEDFKTLALRDKVIASTADSIGWEKLEKKFYGLTEGVSAPGTESSASEKQA